MTDDEDATWDDVEAFTNALGDEFRILWSTKAPPDDAMIAHAERTLGVRFTDEYRAFLRRFGALYLEVDDATWRRPVADEVWPSWQMAYGRIVAGVAANLQDDLSVVSRTAMFREGGAPADFVAVLGDLGYDGAGRLAEWSVEGVAPVTGTLAARVLASLRGLAADRERLRTEPIRKREKWK